MNAAGCIIIKMLKISIIQTGTVEIRPEHVRSKGLPKEIWLLTSRKWTEQLPINAYLIEHERGLVLFDTGQDRQSITDPKYFPGGIVGFFYKRLAKFFIGPNDTITNGLVARGYSPKDIKYVILSHLHQDHIGGARQESQLLVSNVELGQLDKFMPELDGYMTSHIRLPGLQWQAIEFVKADHGLAPFSECQDIFDDGRLILLPTPGHTKGSVSLLINDPSLPPILLVGDITYDYHLMDIEAVPGVGSKRILLETTRKINELKRKLPGLVILAAHDPSAKSLLDGALRAQG
jgi:glyoxylase-like metal-dependent hydrolase (beta-lactamase superfamily II)